MAVELNKKQELLYKYASKGGKDSGLVLLDKIDEVEDKLDEHIEEMAEEIQELKDRIPGLTKVFDAVRGKDGADSEVPGPKGDSPTKEELLSLIQPLIPKPKDGKDGRNGIDGKM